MFLPIQDNFQRDEVEPTVQATKKKKKERKKPAKTPVRSKDIRSILKTVLPPSKL